ncbi:MAG: AtpZ/AtpI family protein [Acidobacteriota bacterium]
MRFLGVGFELAASVAGLTLLGYWIDRHFGSEPWGLLIGLTMGLVGGLYNMVRGTLAAVRQQQLPELEGKPESVEAESESEVQEVTARHEVDP